MAKTNLYAGDHAGNYTSSAESRKSGYGTAPAKAANKGPVKYAGAKTPAKAPTPTARPNASTFGSSGGPQSAKNYTPGGDSQYAAYSSGPSTRGPGTGKSKPAASSAGSAANSVKNYPSTMASRKSPSNDQARYNMSKASSKGGGIMGVLDALDRATGFDKLPSPRSMFKK